MNIRSIACLLTLSVSLTTLTARRVIDVSTFGLLPNTRNDALPALRQVLKACEGQKNVTLLFPKGRYDFYASVPKPSAENVAFLLQQRNGITIDGGGSEFIFHGWMQVTNILESKNIELKNFSVDWDRPFISQATIAEVGENHLDILIDTHQYPYEVRDGKLWFKGEDWEQTVQPRYNNLYDRNTGEILSQTWDSPLQDIFQAPAEELRPGLVRLHATPAIRPERGTYVVLYHYYYAVNGIQVIRSKDIVLKNIHLYHTLSCGVYGEHSENITMDATSTLVNESKGRMFSTIADASHFTNCKGVIRVENCAHTGQGDDFINVHGRHVRIQSISADRRSLLLNIYQQFFDVNDKVWVIDHATTARTACLKVVKKEVVEGMGYRLTFHQPVPPHTSEGDFLENKTWSASFILRNCRILKRNRARGVLVTTPRKVIIEHNYFHTAGTALLLEGDLDHWYESGANTNVKIRHNVFDNCLTSGNATGSRWQWGDAVITITPSHRPTSADTEPYHRNISIKKNEFRVFDTPILRARSVGNLQFRKNAIHTTHAYAPYTWQKSAFLLDGCRSVYISGNKWDRSFTQRLIQIEHMLPSDLIQPLEPGFRLEAVSGFNTYLN